MAQRTILFLGMVAVIALLVTPACYTLLKHPRVKWDTVYEEVNDTRCNSCHIEDELWSYHHPPNHRYDYGIGYDDWYYFYSLPWWYNDYWYYEGDDFETIPLRSRGFRPGADKYGPRRGGAFRPPPGKNPIRTPVRTESSNKGKSDEEPSKNRSVRPKKSKEKEGKEKG